LRENLGRFATVRTAFGWRLETFSTDPGSGSVDLVMSDGAGTRREERCAYLVGCDGASSMVREKLGISLSGTTFSERWLIIDLENQPNSQKHTTVYCDPRRPCILLPGPHQTRRYEFKLHQGESDEAMLDPQVISDLLARHGASPGAQIRRQVVYRFHARVAPVWRRGRVLLAGDAAHLTPPFAGQGMNSGIRDAHNLAWKLAAVVTGRMEAGVLASYELERRAHVWSMIRLALAMGRVMGPPSAVAGIVTRAFFDLLKLYPPASEYVLQMRYKPKPRFSKGFLMPRDRSGRDLHGRLFPQGRVRTADGRSVLLDEVLGTGFALVCLTDDPGRVFGGWVESIRREWQAACVAVLPKGSSMPSIRGLTMVCDEDGTMGDGTRDARETIYLLRPDRYVAGTFPPAEAPRIPGLIEQWLAPA
jgi:3-(3-hydroxy-phenyl)propionate hydroxylase